MKSVGDVSKLFRTAYLSNLAYLVGYLNNKILKKK